MRHALALALALALPSLALAQDPAMGGWALRGREDDGGAATARIEITPDGAGRVRIMRISTRPDGSEQKLEGAAERRGDLLVARLQIVSGLTDRLFEAQGARPVHAVYRVSGDRVRGVLRSPDRAAGFGTCHESGTRASPSSFEPAGDLAFKRVVLCMDGVAYRVLVELHRRGHFQAFSAPGRMISVFPSLSSIAWNRLLGLPPEPGYQATYYDNQVGDTMGVTARKMEGSRFQTRMHHRHTGIVGHGLAYVAPFTVGRNQLRHMIRDLLDHTGSRTAFVYCYQTDPIAHMNGREDLEKVLLDVDREITDLRAKFRQRHGEDLEVVIVSDHGHTLVKGELVKLERHLKQAGFTVEDAIRTRDQVAFQSAGILSSIVLHCQEARESELARHIATMPGVDVVSYDLGGRAQVIVSPRGEARFDVDAASGRFTYTVVRGQDPIDYLPVFARLQAQGRLDQRGGATGRDLFEATTEHAYPDAAHRIRTGHNGLVWNSANVIVSLRNGFENGQGVVKATAALRGRSGTHGGLDQINSAGSFMTTYAPTVPAIRPEDLGRYVSLADYHANDPALELSVTPDPTNLAAGKLTLEVKDTHALATSGQTTVRVTVRRKRFLLRDPIVFDRTYPAPSLERSHETSQIALEGVYARLQRGKSYSITVVIEHRDARGAVRHREERDMSFQHRGGYTVAD